MSIRAAIDDVCARVRDQPGDIDELVDLQVRRVAPLASGTDRDAIVAAALARLRGLGELEAHLEDPDVDELLVNAGREIWVERSGELHHVGELRDHDLTHLIERILAPIGRRVDASSPVVDARLPDRSRVCAVVEPVAVDGPCLSIRRFSDQPRELADFTNDIGTRLCRRLLTTRANLVVSGATSSGKTSLLATLVALLPRSERVLVIEDTAELPLRSGHHVRLEARPASADGPAAVELADLVRAALRLRPDRLVVGEVRGNEVVGLIQALNTGHDGSLATCHANGPLDALQRLETLILQAAPTWPLVAIRQQLGRSVDAVVHVGRGHEGRRRIEAIGEVARPEAGATLPSLAVSPLAETRGGVLVEMSAPTRSRAQ